MVNSSTSPGAYPVTVDFEYKDSNGGPTKNSKTITLLVEMSPLIEISFYEEVGTLSVGQKSTLPLQIVNKSDDSILLGNVTVTVEGATLTNIRCSSAASTAAVT